jgi:hypothetical protein
MIRVEADGFAEPNLAGNLQSIGLYWASPVTVRASENAPSSVVPILRSSSASWVDADPGKTLQLGYKVPSGARSQLLGIALDGRFRSYYAVRTPPAPIGAADLLPLRVSVTQSPPTRLVVIGNSEFLSDFVARSLGRWNTGYFRENIRFLQNLVDWTLLDSDMVAIRSRGISEPKLTTLVRKRQAAIEAMNYAAPLFLLLAIAAVRSFVRGRTAPILPEVE